MKELLLLVTAGIFHSTVDLDSQPIIVVIMADERDLVDISFHIRSIQNKVSIVEPTTFDQLASQSLRFTDGHSASALCIPIRYAVMIGNNNYRSYAPWGVWSTFGKSAFKPDHVTLGMVVRDADYHTGFVVNGTWKVTFIFLEVLLYLSQTKNDDLTGKVDITQLVSGGPRDCGFVNEFNALCGIQGPIYLLYEN